MKRKLSILKTDKIDFKANTNKRQRWTLCNDKWVNP